MNDPRIAIIVPTFRQGNLACEAIASALTQSEPVPYVIIAVNDGCPEDETASSLAGIARCSARVVTLHQHNKGLSGARNAGIRYALHHYKELEAVFLLDADNLLDRHALEVLGGLLDTHPFADWFYPNFDMFGLESNHHNGGSFSRARLAESNYCEAGSLIRTRVFNAGIWFDETMRAGYEDWDFWLQASQVGFQGHPIAQSFFRYRKRAGSMLSASHDQHEKLHQNLKKKHDWLFKGDQVLREAALEGPIINIVSPKRFFTMRDVQNIEPEAQEALIEELYRYSIDPTAGRTAPYWLLTSNAALAMLLRSKFSAGILAQLISGLRDAPATTACFHHMRNNILSVKLDTPDWHARQPIWEGSSAPIADRDYTVSWYLKQLADAQMMLVKTEHMALLANAPDREAALAEFTRDFHPLELHFQMEGLQASDGDMGEMLVGLTDKVQNSPLKSDQVASFRGWRDAPHVDGPDKLHDVLSKNQCGGPSYLFAKKEGRLQIAFALPILQFGGAEKCVIALANALKTLDVDCHLFIYGNQNCSSTQWLREPFSTVHIVNHQGLRSWNGPQYLGSKLAEKPQDDLMAEILAPLCGMDAVIQSGCGVLHHCATALREKGVAMFSWEHLLETSYYGRSYGTPYQFLAFEAVYDGVFTCSNTLADWLAAQGVSRSKILAVPNGPGFRSEVIPHAAPLTDQPLRLGFLGRTDEQKGADRFLEIAERRRGRFSFSLTGRRVVDGREIGSIPDYVTQKDAAFDIPELEAAYAGMDILLMPSRIEGLPLTIFEAQRAGVVPVCTAVGAVSEAIEDGLTGYLVDPQNPVEQMIEILDMLDDDRALFARMSSQVTASIDPWFENAQNVLDMIKSVRQTALDG